MAWFEKEIKKQMANEAQSSMTAMRKRGLQNEQNQIRTMSKARTLRVNENHANPVLAGGNGSKGMRNTKEEGEERGEEGKTNEKKKKKKSIAEANEHEPQEKEPTTVQTSDEDDLGNHQANEENKDEENKYSKYRKPTLIRPEVKGQAEEGKKWSTSCQSSRSTAWKGTKSDKSR